MNGKPVLFLPYGLEKLTQDSVMQYAIPDEYILSSEDELVRCWFCYRSSFTVWDSHIVCYGTGACRRYYVVYPFQNESGQRRRCECGRQMFRLKMYQSQCTFCHRIERLPNPIKQIGVMMDADTREQLRLEGWFKREADGFGPSWHLAAKTQPWEPQVVHSTRDYSWKMRVYRRREEKKIAAGKNPQIDYRKFRDRWKEETGDKAGTE